MTDKKTPVHKKRLTLLPISRGAEERWPSPAAPIHVKRAYDKTIFSHIRIRHYHNQ